MKKTLVLLGLVACVVAPLSVKADPASTRASARDHKNVAVARKDVSGQTTIYITNKSVTGSHLPLVVSRTNGHYSSNSPISVYGRQDLDRTGQLNVQSELYQTEPAISSVGVSRH